MPIIMGGASIAAGIGGGILSGNAAKKAAQKQADAIAAAMAKAQQIIDAVGLPPDQSAPVILDQLSQAGLLTPELEQAVLLQTSKASQVQRDDQLRGTQVKALQEMSKRGRAGLTAEERAEFNKSRGEVQRDLQAKQEQIVNDLAMRGQSGGGAEIAARLLSSQESADRASEEADRIQAIASQRALQAIQAESQMAGNLRTQDFDEDFTKAESQDEFDRFNVENQMAVQQRNVGAKNISQESNLANKQRVEDTNKTNANAEKYNRLERERNFWQDKMRQAEAKVSVLTGGINPMSQAIGNQGQAAANMFAGLGGGAASGFSALSNYYANKEKNNTPTRGNQAGGDNINRGNLA